jgi:hypothetical protein
VLSRGFGSDRRVVASTATHCDGLAALPHAPRAGPTLLFAGKPVGPTANGFAIQML